MVPKRTPVEIIKRAKRILNHCGWAQGAFYNPATGAHCAVGALTAAGYGLKCYGFPKYESMTENSLATSVATNACDDIAVKMTGKSLVVVNDAASSSKEKIIQIFDWAIADLEMQDANT